MQNIERVSGFVPVGGKGKRLQPLTNRWAKPALLMGSGDSRIMDYSLEVLKGTASTFVSLYTHSEIIRHCLGEKERNKRLIILEDSYLGNIGGSLLQHHEIIAQQASDYILIIPGDHVIEGLDISGLVGDAIEKRASITVVLDPRATYGEYLHYRPQDNLVDRVVRHRGPNEIAYTGISLFRSNFLLSRIKKELTTSGDLAVLDVTNQIIFPKIENDQVFAYVLPTESHWDDTGTIDRYYLNNIRFSKGKNVVAQNAGVGQGVKIEKTIVLDNARLEGDCHIVNAIIAPGTRVRNLKKTDSRISVIWSQEK
ncbi:MAG: sugar phosphate nucleotidyltransferase [Candidatus Shapirobacteria bacterium]|nr:sugar phosphate nucleotidyltransferase [Candidatus Shapirobacteria bacterium]